MLEWFGHFEAALLYGIAPLIVFSALNSLVVAGLVRGSNIEMRDAQGLGLSFGGIGIAVGLLTGLSRDGVVGAVIPALLTFLSTFAVYQFGKDTYRDWRPILPIALFCLVFGTICAAVFGASERNSFVDRTRRYEEWRLQYEKVQLPIRREQLEQQLKLPTTKSDEAK
jgi:vacuolar-type H+-ATPase subunit I/STV1